MGSLNTKGLERTGKHVALPLPQNKEIASDNAPGEYSEKVEKIINGARKGDFLEVVLSQVFAGGSKDTPRELFDKIRVINPSPYEFLINLGNEQLIGASPEMFVRVKGRTVETCPISGTVPRGNNAIEDAERILELMTSKKDEAELTMCTDVDRNDKSRVCKPGSVEVVGRRLIEAYSRLFHTVDHVEGQLLEGYDAFDALLSHMWACTEAPESGIWRLQPDNTLKYARFDYHRRAVETEAEAFWLRISGPGDYRYEGADLGILITRGRLMTDDFELTERAQTFISEMLGKYAGVPLNDENRAAAPVSLEPGSFKIL